MGKLFIGGAWVDADTAFAVTDKYTGSVIEEAGGASPEQVSAAVEAARAAFASGPPEPYRRFEILEKAAQLIDGRRETLVETITAETGFTVSDAGVEVSRAVQTFRLSAEEAKRLTGEMVPIDGTPGQSGRLGFTLRFPVGVVAAITPFNSPLNTVAHKVAPALAAGNAVVLKPATYTPLSAVALCRILDDAGLPAGFLNLVPGTGGGVGRALVEDPNVAFITFTGSTAVGKAIQRAAGIRRTQMELGSISATILCADADLEAAVEKIAGAAFRKAGQVCTSVQRLYVENGILAAATDLLGAAAAGLKTGDPRDPETFVGPMIDAFEAERAESWIAEALREGARIVGGNRREGAVFQPTILADVRPAMRVMREEIFAPVVSLVPFTSLDDAIADINATPFGLSAGMFTRDIDRAFKAAREIAVGAFHINETCSSRVDSMPYGGTKESGFGREGPKYAMREMTEEKLVTISLR